MFSKFSPETENCCFASTQAWRQVDCLWWGDPGWTAGASQSLSITQLDRGVTTTTWASHKVAASFRHPPALSWGPPWTADGSLLPYGLHGLQGDLTMGCRGICSGTWSSSSSFLCIDLGVCRGVSDTPSLLWLQLCRIFPPFLTVLSQSLYHRC